MVIEYLPQNKRIILFCVDIVYGINIVIYNSRCKKKKPTLMITVIIVTEFCIYVTDDNNLLYSKMYFRSITIIGLIGTQ